MTSGAEKSLIAFGERLKQVRGALSQSEFADQLGVTKDTIGRYERGDRAPDFLFLHAVAGRPNVDAKWLITGSPTQSADDGSAREKSAHLAHEDMLLLLDCFIAVEGILSKNGRHATHEQKRDLAIKMLAEAKLLDIPVTASSQGFSVLDSSGNRA